MNQRKQFSSVGVAVMLVCLAGGLVATKITNQPYAAIAGALAGIYFLFGIKVVDQWEKVALLRFGRYRGLRGPGAFLIVPVVDSLSRYVDQRVRVTTVSAESALSLIHIFSGVSAGQYITGLLNELLGVGATHGWLPAWLMSGAHQAAGLPMNETAALFAAAVTIYYWWQNTKGIEESSDKALSVMQVTTVMVVLLLGWGFITAFHNHAKLPPLPVPANLHFSPDALGFLGGTRLATMLGMFGILMAFGHSVLAMSGEETLAQVNREIEHPKLKNLKRAAIVIAIYSFIFTGVGTLLATMIIPDNVRVPVYRDNLIAGMAMYMWGPSVLRIVFRVFVVIVGFLILSGAINTSIIGSTGVMMRVAEDGVLTDWFRKPHRRFGTSYRIINLITGLQLFTIIVSRGNVITLGEALSLIHI